MIEHSYKLSIPAPDFLCEAMNLALLAREWIGICYTATNPTWTDGGWSRTFSYYDVYYPLLNNEGMGIQLAQAHRKLKSKYNIDFGSDDTEPSHIILLHQHKRELYIAEFSTGMRFLQEQYPKPDPKQVEINKEQLEQILLEHQKQMQEVIQNPSKYGMHELFECNSNYRNKIINWFNNYCLN